MSDLVFISYSRHSVDAAKRIERQLEDDFKIWRDMRDDHGILPGEDIEVKIREGVRDCMAMVWLVSRNSIVSDWCRIERDIAAELGKFIIPILVEKIERSELPQKYERIRYIDFTDDELEAILSLRRTLRRCSDGTLTETDQAVPADVEVPLYGFDNVPSQPYMLGRDVFLSDLKERIQAAVTNPSEGVFVLRGMAGLGKTTVAMSLIFDREIRSIFTDGILWAALGPDVDPTDIRSMIIGWGEKMGRLDMGRISSNDESVRAERMGKELAALLEEKRVLLIVDDVWDSAHTKMFLAGRANNPVVFTTRDRTIAQAATERARNRIELPKLDEAAAWALFEAHAPTVAADFKDESLKLIRELEGLPLSIYVAGVMLQEEWEIGGETEMESLFADLYTGEALIRSLRSRGDGHDEEDSVLAVIERSVNRLSEETRRAYALLSQLEAKPATFDISKAAILWRMDESQTGPIIRTLMKRGMLERIDRRRYEMHMLFHAHAKMIYDTEYRGTMTEAFKEDDIDFDF